PGAALNTLRIGLWIVAERAFAAERNAEVVLRERADSLVAIPAARAAAEVEQVPERLPAFGLRREHREARRLLYVDGADTAHRPVPSKSREDVAGVVVPPRRIAVDADLAGGGHRPIVAVAVDTVVTGLRLDRRIVDLVLKRLALGHAGGELCFV